MGKIAELFSFRITRDELETAEKRVNNALESCGSDIRVKLGRRYGYWAIDIVKKGGVEDTLSAGLTAKEAKEVLDGLSRLLREVCYKKY
ncbi:MAG: hypothetical protein QW734_05350 [Candidatus Bathyarchaeia archaeon]